MCSFKRAGPIHWKHATHKDDSNHDSYARLLTFLDPLFRLRLSNQSSLIVFCFLFFVCLFFCTDVADVFAPSEVAVRNEMTDLVRMKE